MFEALLKIGKWLFIAIWLAVVLAVFFGNHIIAFLFHDLPFMGASFNQAEWMKAGECTSAPCKIMTSCPRGGMFRDLQRNYLLVDMPKLEVERLIGKGSHDSKRNCTSYPLGMCSGLGIDVDFLSVCYSEDDRVVSVFHYQS